MSSATSYKSFRLCGKIVSLRYLLASFVKFDRILQNKRQATKEQTAFLNLFEGKSKLVKTKREKYLYAQKKTVFNIENGFYNGF